MSAKDKFTQDLTTFIFNQISGTPQGQTHYLDTQAKSLALCVYQGWGKKDLPKILKALLATIHIKTSEDRARSITERLARITPPYPQFEQAFMSMLDTDSKRDRGVTSGYRNFSTTEMGIFAGHLFEYFEKELCIWRGCVEEALTAFEKNRSEHETQQDLATQIFTYSPD